jgi:nicotinate dehydrogenase subunit B
VGTRPLRKSAPGCTLTRKGFEKNGYVATCAEVQCEAGRPPRVVRVVEAFECGAIINPDHLKNQVEGSVVQGLGGALFEAVDFADGKILNPRFAKYRVPRFRDVPQIDVVLVNRTVTIAPAITATGERIRSMPLNAGSSPKATPTGAAAI